MMPDLAASDAPEVELQSGVLYSPADAMLATAIESTLAVVPEARARVFAEHALAIEQHVAAHFPERPWTCTRHVGTDGSTVFRGGVGHSLVIDPAGRLWRARSYEDFDTTYTLGEGTCTIATLTPRYEQMREYQPGPLSNAPC